MDKLQDAIQWANEIIEGRRRGNGDIAYLRVLVDAAKHIMEVYDEEKPRTVINQ